MTSQDVITNHLTIKVKENETNFGELSIDI